ncbi:MAG: hypothetical protein PHE20_03360 [Patescibacteria group bacterium]|nr:hypothetical protein [Patescibacteria group bacterium]
MSLHKLSFSYILLVASALFFLNTNFVFAQSYTFADDSGLKQASAQAGYDTSSNDSLTGYVSKIISVILSVLGIIFLAFTIYGGIVWMTAAGNEEKVKKAKELIIESIIGVIIVIAAYAISYFVLQATTNSGLKTNTPVVTQPNVQ